MTWSIVGVVMTAVFVAMLTSSLSGTFITSMSNKLPTEKVTFDCKKMVFFPKTFCLQVKRRFDNQILKIQGLKKNYI